MTRRPTTAMVAAGQRVDAAMACLMPDDRRIMEASFGWRGTEEELEGFGLTVDELGAVLQSAGDKLDAHYAGLDSTAARRAGRLQ